MVDLKTGLSCRWPAAEIAWMEIVVAVEGFYRHVHFKTTSSTRRSLPRSATPPALPETEESRHCSTLLPAAHRTPIATAFYWLARILRICCGGEWAHDSTCRSMAACALGPLITGQAGRFASSRVASNPRDLMFKLFGQILKCSQIDAGD